MKCFAFAKFQKIAVKFNDKQIEESPERSKQFSLSWTAYELQHIQTKISNISIQKHIKITLFVSLYICGLNTIMNVILLLKIQELYCIIVIET